jgi:NAD(P)-dependent dehydrogenase (short-subunit alcohol dehydrogenase family)
MLIALLGASKGIGYHALLTLLADPANEAVLLLRKPEAMEADPAVSPAIAAGRVTIIKGDATEPADVAKLFDRKVDVVVTTVGE